MERLEQVGDVLLVVYDVPLKHCGMQRAYQGRLLCMAAQRSMHVLQAVAGTARQGRDGALHGPIVTFMLEAEQGTRCARGFWRHAAACSAVQVGQGQNSRMTTSDDKRHAGCVCNACVCNACFYRDARIKK